MTPETLTTLAVAVAGVLGFAVYAFRMTVDRQEQAIARVSAEITTSDKKQDVLETDLQRERQQRMEMSVQLSALQTEMARKEGFHEGQLSLLNTQLSDATDRAQDLRAKMASLTTTLDIYQGKVAALETQMEKVRASLSESEVARKQAETDLQAERQRNAELTARLESRDRDLEQCQAQIRILTERIAVLESTQANDDAVAA